MARFRFSLQRLLDVKGIRKKQEVVILSSLRKREAELVREMEQLNQKIKDVMDKIFVMERGIFKISDIQQCSHFMEFLGNELSRKERELKELRAEIAEKAEEVKKLYREELVLQKLKDRRYLEFLKEEERKEQKELDEIATILFNRRETF